MDAVIFSGPFQMTVERRPKPEIKGPNDAIVKVSVAGICGRYVPLLPRRIGVVLD